MWTQIYSECERLDIGQIIVYAPSGDINLDGIDICDCHDVRVHDCHIDSEDDAICLKSHGPMGLRNIVVENNEMVSRDANGIKLGTATRGPIFGLQILNNVVDGADMAGFALSPWMALQSATCTWPAWKCAMWASQSMSGSARVRREWDRCRRSRQTAVRGSLPQAATRWAR